MSKIKFSTHPDILNSIPHPKPASKFVPSWYKSMSSEHKCPVRETDTIPTIKQCLPVRDLITSGYIIPAWCDMSFKKDSKGFINCQSATPEDYNGQYSIGVSQHSTIQVKGTPLEDFSDGEKLVKLNNPWFIKTPSNYSCILMSPFYQTTGLTILPGIVDTDSHILNTNFPILVTSNEVLVKKGEPLVQVIPFKRDSWTSKVDSYNAKEKTASEVSFFTELKSLYTTKLWKRKYYR